MNFDVIRILSLLQLMALIGCGLAWHLSYRDHIAKPAWLVGWGYGYVIGLLAVAVTLNEIGDQGVTIGQRALTIGMIPATAWVLWLTGREIAATSRRAREALAWMSGLADAEPCTNPDCIRLRDDAAGIVGPHPKH